MYQMKERKKDMTLIAIPVESFEFELLEAYCLGKGKLWNMFFGWRKTVNEGIIGEWAYYKLNCKDYKKIQLKAEIMEEKYDFLSGTTALFLFLNYLAARARTMRAEFTIIPQPPHFVK